MTTFKYVLQACGLSQQEAATYLDVRPDTIKSWSAGRNPVPGGVWTMLAELYQRVQDAADIGLERMDLDGIDPRAFNNIAVDLGGELLPEGSANLAGAIALLEAIRPTR